MLAHKDCLQLLLPTADRDNGRPWRAWGITVGLAQWGPNAVARALHGGEWDGAAEDCRATRDKTTSNSGQGPN